MSPRRGEEDTERMTNKTMKTLKDLRDNDMKTYSELRKTFDDIKCETGRLENNNQNNNQWLQEQTKEDL